MRRSWIFAATAAAVITVAGWWAQPEVGKGGCPGGEPCAAGPSTPGSSVGPTWFYGGEGVHRIREGSDRPDAREVPAGENRCDRSHTSGDGMSPRGCGAVRARFY